MRQSLRAIFGSLSIILPAFPSLCSASSRLFATQGITLKPIAIRDFERASGIERRRASEDFSNLNLQTQSQLIYGSPGGLHRYPYQYDSVKLTKIPRQWLTPSCEHDSLRP